LFGVPLSA
jgi:hypothetical protein